MIFRKLISIARNSFELFFYYVAVKTLDVNSFMGIFKLELSPPTQPFSFKSAQAMAIKEIQAKDLMSLSR